MQGQITKRGDAWLLTIFLGRNAAGKVSRFTKTVHGPKREAQAVLTELVSAHNRGELLKSHHTVDKLFSDWLKHLEITGKVRPRTIHSYRMGVERYLRPAFGGKTLASLKPSDIVAMMLSMRERGLAPVTIRKAREVLRAALSYAMMGDLIKTNPAKHELVKASLPKLTRTKRQTITAADVKVFHDATEGERLRVYWLLLLCSGLRPSEALALKWSSIDGTSVQIERTLTDGIPTGTDKRHTYELTEPKSESSRRTVVLPGLVLAALRRQRVEQLAEQMQAGEMWSGADFIFCNQLGYPLRQQDTRRSFARILAKGNLPRMRIYDLRHSAASLRLENGDDLHVVKELLGHSTIKLTADTYGHGTQKRQQASVEKLERLFA